ncbi:MAG: two-component system response regulator [Thermodesulfovibrio sp.]|nr:two-component system response regulator [Thermodesulfovibrio sp.]
MKILVVDDCQTTRKLLSLYLKSKGYTVATAENGLDAIEKLGTDTINLVLTDLNMPYMDGLELIRTLKADPNLSAIPIIMVTTEADPEEKAKAMDAGAAAYMVKPVTADKVSENILLILKQMFGKGGATSV